MRRALLFGLAAAGVALPAAGQIAPATFPHIVVIVLDDVGVDGLSCYGEGADTPNTPNICERLAENGALFRNAWSNPTCSPTRSTVQTGRYGFRTGVTFAGIPLPLGEVTLAEVLTDPLQQLGYATAAIGKWHLSGGNGSGPPNCPASGNPQDQGYDHAAGALTNIGNYFNWCRRVNGVNGVCAAGGSVAECAAQPYATIVNVNDALDWIGAQSGPWFLWLAFNAPHSPFQAPPDQCPTGPCHGVVLPPGVDPGDVCPGTDPRPCYKAMIETVDTEIGRLLDALPADTAILVLGDNGSPGQVVVPPFDPLRAKFTVYEGGVNVPLILTAANVATPGSEIKTLVNTSDLFATVLDLAGGGIPAGIVHDAVSLVDVLRGTAKPRRFVFTEHLAATQPAFRKAAREARYKVIRTPNTTGTNEVEFYDLSADPFENFDLYDDLQPDLGAEEQAAFDDLQLFFDYLDGLVATCPATRSCGPVGSCQPVPVPEGFEPIPIPIPTCTFADTGLTVCGEPGTVFECPPGMTIHLRKCPCRVILEPTLHAQPICFRTSLTLVCR